METKGYLFWFLQTLKGAVFNEFGVGFQLIPFPSHVRSGHCLKRGVFTTLSRGCVCAMGVCASSQRTVSTGQ